MRKFDPYQSVGCAALALISHVGHIGKYDRKCNGKDAANGNHGEIPPRVDVDERDRGACEEDGDQQEELPAPNIRQSAHQRGRQK